MNRARYTHTVRRDKQSLPTKRIYQLSEPTRGNWRYTRRDSCGKGSREGVKTGPPAPPFGLSPKVYIIYLIRRRSFPLKLQKLVSKARFTHTRPPQGTGSSQPRQTAA